MKTVLMIVICSTIIGVAAVWVYMGMGQVPLSSMPDPEKVTEEAVACKLSSGGDDMRAFAITMSGIKSDRKRSKTKAFWMATGTYVAIAAVGIFAAYTGTTAAAVISGKACFVFSAPYFAKKVYDEESPKMHPVASVEYDGWILSPSRDEHRLIEMVGGTHQRWVSGRGEAVYYFTEEKVIELLRDHFIMTLEFR